MRNQLDSMVRVSIVALVALVAGCSLMPDSKKIDYGTAAKAPPLDIPPDLTRPSNTTQYSAPNVATTGTAIFSQVNAKNQVAKNQKTDESILPEGSRGVARIERQGNQRWLVVSVPEDKAWNVTKAFWQENGFVIKKEDAQTGVMETDWAENRANIPTDSIRGFLGKALGTLYSTPERDMYRTRLEKGSKPGVTEIFISHRGMVEVYINEGKDQTRWQPRDADPTLEAEMLRRLMFKFDGVSTEEAKQLAAKQSDVPKSQDKARMATAPDGGAMLVLDDSFDRSWRRVGLALDRVGFTVEDRERASGLYYVRYVDSDEKGVQEKKEGFWSKLAFWSSKDDKVPTKVQYRISVREQQPGGPTGIVVLAPGDTGAADVSPVARQILELLLQQLR
ncbi:MAG: outer membrane protein assembly factor BamC [Fluviibacter sp.]|jgi:outer membrane protein assembly factor BamC